MGEFGIVFSLFQHLEEAILQSVVRIQLKQPAHVGSRDRVNHIQPLLSSYVAVFV